MTGGTSGRFYNPSSRSNAERTGAKAASIDPKVVALKYPARRVESSLLLPSSVDNS